MGFLSAHPSAPKPPKVQAPAAPTPNLNGVVTGDQSKQVNPTDSVLNPGATTRSAFLGY